jgi:predicted secreted hydrolase
MIDLFRLPILHCFRSRRSSIAMQGIFVALMVGCASTTHIPLRIAEMVPTATPAPIQLPGDDVPHDVLTEWWYYTGHLSGPSGEKYGFEEVIFQVERQDVPPFYAAHFAITDHQRGEFHFDQRTWFRQARSVAFDLGDGNWRISGNGSSDQLQASIADYAFEATFAPTKPPALHGDKGVISFGPIGDSYYYSITRAAIVGTIVDHGESIPVTGEAWKDRQWGNFLVTPAGGWDWFSLQLGDGSEIMLFMLRDALGSASPAYGTLVDAAGNTTTIGPNLVRVGATGSWVSPHTGSSYPSGWSIELPDRDLHLTITPVQLDQELDTRASTGQIYWEGEVTIDGQNRGKPLDGKGYVELTGYAQPRVAPSNHPTTP